MFERYTERARRVLFFARYEASHYGGTAIETEHLLLGLIREGKGLTSRVFARSRLSLDSLRRDIESRLTSREPIPVTVEIPFSATAKRVLQAAAQEADRLLHNHIGTEHLLLALLAVEDGLAAEILIGHGLRLHVVREDIVMLLNQKTAVASEQVTPPRVMARSNRSPTLVELFAAIVADEAEAVRLVRATPEIAQARVGEERLVEEVPHQLYVGDTALHLAAAALRTIAVGALIDAGADSNAENRRGATALHYACDPRPKTGMIWSPSRQRSVIERLLDAGADIEHRDKAGAAPLHRAVRARSPEAVRCLLERGARVNATHGRRRTTPLHIATHSTGASGTKGARAEQEEIVELLLHHGADPDSRARRSSIG